MEMICPKAKECNISCNHNKPHEEGFFCHIYGTSCPRCVPHKPKEEKMEFKVGDKVIYASGRWGDSEFNPLWSGGYGKIIGTIDEIDFSSHINSYGVKWNNGKHNTYNKEDLELYLKEEKKTMKGNKKELLVVVDEALDKWHDVERAFNKNCTLCDYKGKHAYCPLDKKVRTNFIGCVCTENWRKTRDGIDGMIKDLEIAKQEILSMPDEEEKVYHVGQRFVGETGTEFLLAMVNSYTVNLITKDGTQCWYPLKVKDVWYVTEEEFKKLCGNNGKFTLKEETKKGVS